MVSFAQWIYVDLSCMSSNRYYVTLWPRHPTSDFKKCSNNLDYPSDWNQPPAFDTFMSTSSDECCSSFFAGSLAAGKPCPIDDICNAPSAPTCEGNKW